MVSRGKPLDTNFLTFGHSFDHSFSFGQEKMEAIIFLD